MVTRPKKTVQVLNAEVPAISKNSSVKEEIKMVKVADLLFDSDVMTRAAFNDAVVTKYANSMLETKEAGKPYDFPAITVVKTKTGTLIISDGGHRYKAAQKAELSEILCRIIEGDKRDALLYGLGANAKHGLQRNGKDLKVCVGKLLKDKEWSSRSDPWLAEQAGCSESYIRKVKKEMMKDGYIHPAIITYKDSKGREKLMLNKTVAALHLKEAEEKRLDQIVPSLEDLTDVLTATQLLLVSVKPENLKSIITNLKLQCVLLLKGETPFDENIEEEKSA